MNSLYDIENGLLEAFAMENPDISMKLLQEY